MNGSDLDILIAQRATFGAAGGGDDAAYLAWLGETSSNRIVPKARVRAYLKDAAGPVSILLRITLAAAQLPAAAQAIAYLNAADWDVVDFDSPVASQMFPSLVAAGVITQAEQDAAIAALTIKARWQELGLSEAPTQTHLDLAAKWGLVKALDAKRSDVNWKLSQRVEYLSTQIGLGNLPDVPTWADALAQAGG